MSNPILLAYNPIIILLPQSLKVSELFLLDKNKEIAAQIETNKRTITQSMHDAVAMASAANTSAGYEGTILAYDATKEVTDFLESYAQTGRYKIQHLQLPLDLDAITTPKKIDLLDYIGPHGTQYLLDVFDANGVFTQQEKIRIHFGVNGNGLNYFIIQKNRNYERYYFDQSWIYSGEDSSHSHDLGYVVRRGQDLATVVPRFPRYMHKDQAFLGSSHWVQFFYKLTAIKYSPKPTGWATNAARLKTIGDLWQRGNLVKDCIELSTTNDEVQQWQLARGPVGWISQWGSATLSLDQGNVAEQAGESFSLYQPSWLPEAKA